VAIAGRDEDPGIGIAVDARGAGTGIVAGRGAIVLAGLGKTVALFGREARLGRGTGLGDGGAGERDGGGEGRCKQGAGHERFLRWTRTGGTPAPDRYSPARRHLLRPGRELTGS